MSSWTQRNAPWLFAAVGFGFFLIGAGLALSNSMYSRFGATVVGAVTDVGNSGGGSSSYVAYRFELDGGGAHTGRSSGYSGRVGETIKIEYLSIVPGWNRVAGAGRRAARWQWWIAGFGGLFTVAGLHWGLALRLRRRLSLALRRDGSRTTGEVTQVASNAVVRYRFVANGRDYTGRTLGTNPEQARSLAAGDALPVLYDRADPARNIWFDE